MAIESNFKNMVLVLFSVTFIASAGLAYVYDMTREPKLKAEMAKKTEALKEVVPAFDNDPISESYTIKADNGSELICYPVKQGGELVATAIESFSPLGYAGDIKIMVGLLPDGTIYDTVVIAHKETPGLGDKMEKKKSEFTKQFREKNPVNFKLKIKKDGGDVDAITAATFSSRAYVDAVQRAYLAYKKANAS
jgi:electron transport complex protein RnfG